MVYNGILMETIGFPSEGNSMLRPLEGAMGTPSA